MGAAPAQPAPMHAEAAEATPAKQPKPAVAPAAYSASKEPDAQQLLDRLQEDVHKKGADIACGNRTCLDDASATAGAGAFRAGVPHAHA